MSVGFNQNKKMIEFRNEIFGRKQLDLDHIHEEDDILENTRNLIDYTKKTDFEKLSSDMGSIPDVLSMDDANHSALDQINNFTTHQNFDDTMGLVMPTFPHIQTPPQQLHRPFSP